MYKTILVPLDGSRRAERILTHVENLAQCLKARVVFLQVLTYPNIVAYHETEILLYRQDMKQMKQQATDYLAAQKGKFREKGIEAKICVVNGSVVREIIDCSEREGAGLVAMTSHGRSGLARAFYGSVAAGVLQLIDRPLLIIRSRGET